MTLTGSQTPVGHAVKPHGDDLGGEPRVVATPIQPGRVL